MSKTVIEYCYVEIERAHKEMDFMLLETKRETILKLLEIRLTLQYVPCLRES